MSLDPAASAPRTHVLSVILEDYFQVAPLRTVVQPGQWHRFESRVHANTRKALELLEEFDFKATFFVGGWLADEMPELVREVADRGHEIACKGYFHRSIRQLSREEFREDVVRAREALERASGSPVLGHRIAHGWLQPSDLWALDVLAEEGFGYDSSIRPLFRSYSHQPWRRFLHPHQHGDATLWELPVSTWSLGRWSLPIGGGNHLRQFPGWLTNRAISRWDRSYDSPLMFYFHVWELDPEQPRINAVPYLSRVRQYRHLSRMPGILRRYLAQYPFVGAASYLGLDAADRALSTEVEVESEGVTSESASVAPSNSPAAEPPHRTPLTVVVPCFNEELILPYLANTLNSLVETLTDYELFFVFVDDGSVDGTFASMRRLFGDRADCEILRHSVNRGVAAGILAGIRSARTEIVCSLDCDCSYDPLQLQTMVPMLEDGVTMVTGSPYHRDGLVRNVPAWRLLSSKTVSKLYRLVLRQNLATYTSCFRVYRREAFLDLPVREGGFLGVAEMLGLLVLRGATIVECPAVLEVRLIGRSKMKFSRTVVGHLVLLCRFAWARLTSREPSASSAIDASEYAVVSHASSDPGEDIR